jgi:hypothetical protein
MTFNEFYSKISQSVFPEGEAENLIVQHKNAVRDALIELQTKVPCLRGVHAEYVGQSSTVFHCGSSVFDSVNGNIERVYTQALASACDEIDYRYISHDQMRELIHNYRCCRVFTAPGMTPYTYDPGQTPHPGPPEYVIGGPDTNKSYRARPGTVYWSIDKGSIYVFPSIESTEQIVVEWTGIQRDFADTTTISETFTARDVMSAVEKYLEAEVARRETKQPGDYKAASMEWDSAVALLIWNCNRARKTTQPVVGPKYNAC